MQDQSGFKELSHTADWMIKVWASDFPGLLVESARGMYALMGVQHGRDEQYFRDVVISAEDRESLLVSFLTELLFLIEKDLLYFEDFDLTLTNGSIRGKLIGYKVDNHYKEIKAVTFHKLDVKEFEDHLEVTIVFDV